MLSQLISLFILPFEYMTNSQGCLFVVLISISVSSPMVIAIVPVLLCIISLFLAQYKCMSS
uniref:Uncharacterized protein n=1 Tax=Arundo donax TaxID=35708 RepID=A0A0A9E6W0_ARUDO